MGIGIPIMNLRCPHDLFQVYKGISYTSKTVCLLSEKEAQMYVLI